MYVDSSEPCLSWYIINNCSFLWCFTKKVVSVKLVLKVINLICVNWVVEGADPLPSPTGLTNSLLSTPPSANTMPYSSCLQVNGTSYIRCIEFRIQNFWWIRVGGVRTKYWTIEHNFKIFDQKCNIQYVLSGLFYKECPNLRLSRGKVWLL
jgi:hypothetical protein